MDAMLIRCGVDLPALAPDTQPETTIVVINIIIYE